MEALLIYLLKSAGILSIFYLIYLLLLKNETFFTNNRRFLLGGIFASFILPALYFTRTIFVQPPQGNFFLSSSTGLPPVPVEQDLDWWQIVGIIYFIISGFLLLKFILQLFKVINLVLSKEHYKEGKFRMIETLAEGPFSFFNYIIYNPGLHSKEELRLIMKHEKVHARQWHSIDILISHLVCCVLWFNPLSWLYRKKITENLEYIADKETVTETASKKEYLHTLVKVTMGEFQPALTNQFYQPFIKKRIMMLNKKTNNHNNLWKMGIVLPALLAFMLAFNVRTEAQVINNKNNAEITETRIAVVITKKTKDEGLDQLKKIMRKKNVEIDFEEVKRNKEGFISSIKVELLNKNTNTTANYVVSHTEGISPFEIYVEDNGQAGFTSVSEDAGNTGNVNIAFSQIGKNPLYIINKNEYSSAELDGKTIQINNGFSVLDSEEGNKTYGNKAIDGVVIIADGKIIDDFKAELKDIDSKKKNTRRNYLQVSKGEKPTYIELNNQNPQTKVSVKGSKEDKATENDKEKIIYVVNGKPSSQTVVTQISPEKVENVTVYKGTHAQALYGSGAKNGAIVITTINASDSSGTGVTYQAGNIIIADTTGVYQTRNYYPSQVSYTASDSTSTIRIVNSSGGEGKEPLYIINGKVMPADFDSKEIEENSIESIKVWKGETALEKFGKKGKYGVIEITTKGNKVNKKD